MVDGISLIEERWLWLSSSVALAVLASWVRWFISRPSDDLPSWINRWRHWSGRPWVEEFLRLGFMVGIPAVALLWRGVLTERGLGLQPLLLTESSVPLDVRQANWQNWMTDIGWTVGIVAVTGLSLGLGSYQQRRLKQWDVAVHHDPGTALREAIYHQSHWAFYREPFVLLWGPEIGSWIGVLPVLIESMLNPQRWDDLQTYERGRNVLVRAALAVMSALIFLKTQNIWCALMADVAVGIALGIAAPHPKIQGQRDIATAQAEAPGLP